VPGDSLSAGRFVFFEVMDLPFLFKSGAEASVAMWDLFDKEKPKILDEVKVLTAFTCATASIMSQKPVRNLADLQDLKLRAAGTGVDIMSLWEPPRKECRCLRCLKPYKRRGSRTCQLAGSPQGHEIRGILQACHIR